MNEDLRKRIDKIYELDSFRTGMTGDRDWLALYRPNNEEAASVCTIFEDTLDIVADNIFSGNNNAQFIAAAPEMVRIIRELDKLVEAS